MSKYSIFFSIICVFILSFFEGCSGNGMQADSQSEDEKSYNHSSSSSKKVKSSSSKRRMSSASVKLSSERKTQSSSSKKISSSSVVKKSSSSKAGSNFERLSSSSVVLSSSSLKNVVIARDSSASVVSPSSLVVGSFTDTRNGQIYKTVQIGSQIWLAENLNYAVENSYCYNDSLEYCEKYGRLYTWATAIGKTEEECGYQKTCGISSRVQGICPSGWHLPSKTEWNTLFESVGGQSIAGKMLKSSLGWFNDYNGSDDYWFSIFPAGVRDFDGDYFSVNEYAGFWSSTEYDEDNAQFIYFYFYDENVFQSKNFKDYGFAVRCVKD